MRLFRHSETPEQRAVRRLRAAYANLVTVANELEDPVDVDARADLVIAAEDLGDVTAHILEAARDIAWQHSPVPESGESDL
jgi:hypothetical protein